MQRILVGLLSVLLVATGCGGSFDRAVATDVLREFAFQVQSMPVVPGKGCEVYPQPLMAPTMFDPKLALSRFSKDASELVSLGLLDLTANRRSPTEADLPDWCARETVSAARATKTAHLFVWQTAVSREAQKRGVPEAGGPITIATVKLEGLVDEPNITGESSARATFRWQWSQALPNYQVMESSGTGTVEYRRDGGVWRVDRVTTKPACAAEPCIDMTRRPR